MKHGRSIVGARRTARLRYGVNDPLDERRSLPPCPSARGVVCGSRECEPVQEVNGLVVPGVAAHLDETLVDGKRDAGGAKRLAQLRCKPPRHVHPDRNGIVAQSCGTPTGIHPDALSRPPARARRGRHVVEDRGSSMAVKTRGHPMARARAPRASAVARQVASSDARRLLVEILTGASWAESGGLSAGVRGRPRRARW